MDVRKILSYLDTSVKEFSLFVTGTATERILLNVLESQEGYRNLVMLICDLKLPCREERDLREKPAAIYEKLMEAALTRKEWAMIGLFDLNQVTLRLRKAERTVA